MTSKLGHLRSLSGSFKVIHLVTVTVIGNDTFGQATSLPISGLL